MRRNPRVHFVPLLAFAVLSADRASSEWTPGECSQPSFEACLDCCETEAADEVELSLCTGDDCIVPLSTSIDVVEAFAEPQDSACAADTCAIAMFAGGATVVQCLAGPTLRGPLVFAFDGNSTGGQLSMAPGPGETYYLSYRTFGLGLGIDIIDCETPQVALSFPASPDDGSNRFEPVAVDLPNGNVRLANVNSTTGEFEVREFDSSGTQIGATLRVSDMGLFAERFEYVVADDGSLDGLPVYVLEDEVAGNITLGFGDLDPASRLVIAGSLRSVEAREWDGQPIVSVSFDDPNGNFTTRYIALDKTPLLDSFGFRADPVIWGDGFGTGKWHHVVYVEEGTDTASWNIQVFVDGQPAKNLGDLEVFQNVVGNPQALTMTEGSILITALVDDGQGAEVVALFLDGEGASPVPLLPLSGLLALSVLLVVASRLGSRPAPERGGASG